MMNRLRALLAGLMILPTLSLVTTVALPSARAAAVSCSQSPTFLTFPAWYKGLQGGGTDGCAFKPKTGSKGIQNTIIIIALNVINIILQLVGYAAVVFLIIGGFNYMTSVGEASKIQAAKKTIMNAIVGLVISIMSVAIINLVVGAF